MGVPDDGEQNLLCFLSHDNGLTGRWCVGSFSRGSFEFPNGAYSPTTIFPNGDDRGHNAIKVTKWRRIK